MPRLPLVSLVFATTLAGCLPAGMAPAGGRAPDGLGPGFSLGAAGDQALVLDRGGRLWEWGLHPLATPAAPKGERARPAAVALLERVKGMAASEDDAGVGSTAHLVAVREDGTVWTWGDNDRGQAGHGGPASDKPVQVPGLAGVAAVDAGWKYSLALKADGTVWSWGHNGSGQLGDGTDVARPKPGPVAGLEGVAMVRAGRHHALALGRDGKVRGWGANDVGQLGMPLGEVTSHADLRVAAPTAIPGLADVVEIAAASDYSLARRADGTVWAWGRARHGVLGQDLKARAATAPAAVPGLAGVKALAAGRGHALALLSDGRVASWGANDLGELGRGTAGFGKVDPTPKPVEGLAGVVAIAAGRHFSLAIDQDARVWAWGSNAGGQHGQGTAALAGSTKPVMVLAPAGDGAWKVAP